MGLKKLSYERMGLIWVAYMTLAVLVFCVGIGELSKALLGIGAFLAAVGGVGFWVYVFIKSD